MDMKRFILCLLLFVCFCTAVCAEDEIYLQKDFHISPQNAYEYMNKDPYSKQSKSFKREKKRGNFSF